MILPAIITHCPPLSLVADLYSSFILYLSITSQSYITITTCLIQSYIFQGGVKLEMLLKMEQVNQEQIEHTAMEFNLFLSLLVEFLGSALL